MHAHPARRRRFPALTGAAAALLCALGAVAQPGSSRRPEVALTRVSTTARQWTVHAEVRILSGQPRATDVIGAQPQPSFRLTSAQVIYPAIRNTASSEAELFRYNGELWIENRIIDNEPRILDGYQGLSSIAVWDAPGFAAHAVTLKVNISSTCYETRINEAVARSYTWPTQPWGPELALCLEPQLFVEVNDPAIVALVKTWTKGKPRSARPYDLAKFLAAETLAHFRRTQGIREFGDRTTGVTIPGNAYPQVNAFQSGFRVNGAAFAARTRTGSAYDLACLLTAVYRAAGIPARMVIGYDIEASEKAEFPVLRAWVEFFLARDPKQPKDVAEPVPVSPADGEWIPVDITRQQEFASRAPPINQRWQFFGHNEELDLVPPIAMHWVPPSFATNAGAAAIWGWLPQPANPIAEQQLTFWTQPTVIRGDDPDVRRR